MQISSENPETDNYDDDEDLYDGYDDDEFSPKIENEVTPVAEPATTERIIIPAVVFVSEKCSYFFKYAVRLRIKSSNSVGSCFIDGL